MFTVPEDFVSRAENGFLGEIHEMSYVSSAYLYSIKVFVQTKNYHHFFLIICTTPRHLYFGWRIDSAKTLTKLLKNALKIPSSIDSHTLNPQRTLGTDEIM